MPVLKLYVLGRFKALLNDQPLEKFRSDKARALLVYLAMSGGQALDRRHLASFLWHGFRPASAQSNLRVTLSNLRQLLAPLDILHIDYKTVRFDANSPLLWLDATAAFTDPQAKGPAVFSPASSETMQFLYGFETLDSEPFQIWLQQRRTYFWHLQRQSQKLPTTVDDREAPGPLAATSDQNAVASHLAGGAEPLEQDAFVATPARATWVDDLNQAPPVTAFYGREDELAQLQEWIVDQHCSLVAILGMGGQGKSTLAARLIQQQAAQDAQSGDQGTRTYAHILWSSLLNAPPLSELLKDWLQALSEQPINQHPTTLEEQLRLLLGSLRRRRCLLVLDNVENIMLAGERAGHYRPGYEDYSQLFQLIGERNHQSCLLLTTREEPHEWRRLEIGGTNRHRLRLHGLSVAAAQAMLHAFGIQGTATATQQLVERYSGNPLALKLVAVTIQDFFGGDIARFLAQETLVFDDIRALLDQHFARLSPTERDLLYWLAIEREPLPFAVLNANLVQSASRSDGLEAIHSLQRRALVEQVGDDVGLQNVIIEYMTDRLIAEICQELAHDRLTGWQDEKMTATDAHLVNLASSHRVTDSHFNRFALVKAQAKEHIRQCQVRLLLMPVAEWLNAHYGKERLALVAQQLFHHLQTVLPLAPGYAAANMLHILMQRNIDIRGYDFSHLTFRQADLRGRNLTGVKFTRADLSDSLFDEPFETIRSLLFTPDGRYLVGGAYNGNIHVWRLVDRRPEQLLRGHRGVAYALAIRPANSAGPQMLASASADRTVRLWDLTSGELYCTLRGHGGEVVMVAFDAGGQSLTSMDQNGVTNIWNIGSLPGATASDQPVTTFGGTAKPTCHAAASGDGAWVAAGGDDTLIHCWEVRSGQLRATLHGHTHAIVGLAFSPDGKTLASSSHDQTIRLWRLADESDGGEPYQQGHLLPEVAEQLAFGADGALLASGTEGQISLWDVTSGQLRQRFSGHVGRISALAFSPDGATLASAGYDQTVQLWNLQTGQAEYKLYGQARAVELVSFSPDGAMIVSSYFDHTVHLWARDGRHLHTLHGHQDVVRHAAWSADSRLLATAGNDKIIRLWDVMSAEQRFSLRGHAGSVNGLAFRPGSADAGATLVSGGGDAMVCLWDSEKGERLKALQGHSSQIKFVTFNPAGTLLATASGDQTIRIWEMPSGRLRHVLSGHTGIVRTVAFHADGRLLASASDDATVRIWDAVDGSLRQTLQGHTHAVIIARFSEDGKTIVSASDDQTLRVWALDAANGDYRHAHTLLESIYKHNCLALMPDNVTLVSGGLDGNIHLWNLDSGQLRRTLKSHTNLITAVAIRPDGRQIVSGCSDGVVRLWNAESGVCLHALTPAGPYAGMEIRGVTGITAAQRAALKTLGAVEEEGA